MDLVNRLPKAGEEQEGEYSVVDHMLATALWEISLLEAQDFDKIKISMKAFDVPTTVEAYRRLSEMVPYPLHLGITEAGTVQSRLDTHRRGPGSATLRGYRETPSGVSLSGDSRDESHSRLRDSQVPEPAAEGGCPSSPAQAAAAPTWT